MYWAVISASSLWFSTQSPEIMYNRAFDAFNGKRYDEASPLFKRAFAGRHSPSKKEEALFWLAKTTELSGNKDEAVRLYKEVMANYHGYWVPESLYTVIQLSRGLGLDENIKQYEERLKEEYPNSKWVVKTR
jgi:TolA-binding protein